MNGVPADAGASAPLPRSLLHPRHWPAWLGLGAFSLALLLPRRLRDGAAALAGELRYRTNARRRGIVELNLDYCFPALTPGERRARARAHFRAYARAMANQPAIWWDRRRRIPRERCDIDGLEHVHAARADGRPVILLVAHTVVVEIGGIGLSRELPVAAVANELRDPVLDWVVQRARARYGFGVHPRSAGLRPALRDLRAGRALFYSADEDLGARNSVFVPFFGHPKATLATLGRLAGAVDAVVLPVYPTYDAAAGRYRVYVRAPLAGFPSGDAETDARAMNRALEECIPLAPAQYLWSFRLFRTRADGTRMPYPARRKRL